MVNEHEKMKVVELPNVDYVIAVDQSLVMGSELEQTGEFLNDDDGVNDAVQSLAMVNVLE
jgi:hypothetical protein